MFEPSQGFAIALILAFLDAILLAHYGTPIWSFWGQTAMCRAVLTMPLLLWVASAGILRLQVYFGVRRMLAKHRARVSEPAPLPPIATEETN
jgi:hypothetical protein